MDATPLPSSGHQSPFPWTATYRLQLHGGFPLAAAEEILPYLARLGISHVYLSPVLQAATGSTHGYDVADPSFVSEELGGELGWTAFQQSAREHGLRVLLDIVPNHMTTATSNPWWSSLLANGPYSSHTRSFDVMPFAIAEKWLIAICTLGGPYGKVIAAGDITIDLNGTLPRVRYFDQTWPLGVASWRHWISVVPPEMAFPLAELTSLRSRFSPAPDEISRYRELATRVEQTMAGLLRDDAARQRLQDVCDAIAADPARMHQVLEDQYYRLCWWKLEGEIVNYRRFFNIGTLAGVCVERPEVFEAAHARIAQMVASDDVDGLRVDHPDGLRDPRQYFERLRALLPDGRIYAEKILDAEEELPTDWLIDGTVGYEFLSKVNRLWIDEHKADSFTAAYADFTGHPVNYPALVREKKLEIIEGHFRADLERLTTQALNIAQSRWQTHDLSRVQMRTALKLLTAALPVYRTYLTPDALPASAVDEKIVEDATAAARTLATGVESEVFEFLESVLTKELSGSLEDDFIARWQQLAPAVMAKGAEDTTFYLYDRLVSCNEVGSQPSHFGISTEKFHQFLSHLHSRWPASLLATSTHDNKRSEDVRARISVLTEVPERWSAALTRWSILNQPSWRGREPDRHAEYLLYQTLIGAWPISFDRAWGYMLKACREAKIRTSWHEPNEAYEEGIREFTESVLESPEFLAELETFVSPLIDPGRVNSLAQSLIKMTAPGTPDFYQGTELWDLSLVDPDNRRPVNFTERTEILNRAATLNAREAMAAWDTGLTKLWMIHRTLAVRRSHAAAFGPDAVYQPRSARGSRLGHLLTYQRGDDVLVIVPRFTLALGDDWDDTVIGLPQGSWRNVFTEAALTGDVSPLEVFGDFPVALAVRTD